jgi:hypothetical protein
VIVQLPPGDLRKNQSLQVLWAIGAQRTAAVNFVCDEGRDAPRGHGMFITGDHPALGSWNPDQAVPLRSSEYARGVWSKVVKGMAPGVQTSWKCLRKMPGGGQSNVEWQAGNNNQFHVDSSGGFAGSATAIW